MVIDSADEFILEMLSSMHDKLINFFGFDLSQESAMFFFIRLYIMYLLLKKNKKMCFGKVCLFSKPVCEQKSLRLMPHKPHAIFLRIY